MQTKQSRALQCYRRVEAWFGEHPEVIPATGSSAATLTSQVAALQQLVQQMTAHATQQATQASQSTLASRDESTLRHDVRMLHMRSIVQVADSLRGQVPGIGVFKTPSPKMGSESLVQAAAAMHTTAAPYESVLVQHGLPVDFLSQLDAAAAALKSSVDARGVALSVRAGAGTGLEDDLKLGRQILTQISAALTHALKSDPVTLASWRQARRVTVKGVKPKAVAAAASPAGAGQPAAGNGVPGSETASDATAVGAPAAGAGDRSTAAGAGAVVVGVAAVPPSASGHGGDATPGSGGVTAVGSTNSKAA